MTPPTHSIYWDLPILIVVVSLVYSATRYDGWPAIIHEAARWGLRMTAFLGSIGLVLFWLDWWVGAGTPWWGLAIAGAAALVGVVVFIAVAAKKDTAVSS
jgi:hypothetical protein